MTRRFLLAMLILLAIASLDARASNEPKWGHPQVPRAGACFYKETGFAGDYFCISSGRSYNVLPDGLNDRISSIRVFGGATVRIYNDSNFCGLQMQFRKDVANLKKVALPSDPGKNWDDRISSIAVRSH
jgi:hypothetical protein